MFCKSREDWDNPDVGKKGPKHVEDPPGKAHSRKGSPNEVMTHSVKGPLGVQKKAVSLFFLGHSLVEVVSQTLDMPLTITFRGETNLVRMDNSFHRRRHRISDRGSNDPVVAVSDRDAAGVIYKAPGLFREKEEPSRIEALWGERDVGHTDQHRMNIMSKLGVDAEEGPVDGEGDAVWSGG